MRWIIISIVSIFMQTGIVMQSAADDLQVKTFQLFKELSMTDEKNTSYEFEYEDDLSQVCRVSNRRADRLIREYVKSTQRGVSSDDVTRAVSIITSKIPLYVDHIGDNDGIIRNDELLEFKQIATHNDALVYLFCVISAYHAQ